MIKAKTKKSRALIIFVRVPELGKVKTRLAREVGDVQALTIYKALLQHTRSVTLSVDADRYLYYHNDTAEDEWSPEHFIKKVQAEGILGIKLQSAFEDISKHSDKILVIGSDCPQLSSDHIEEAFTALDNYDCVVGPSLDGGYYLFGTKKYQEEMFINIDWSTDRVYNQTIAAISKLRLTHTTIEKLSDVDYKKDWDNYGWKL